MYRAIRWVVLVGVAWAATAALPSVARYLKMRRM
jgi:hypothetical protein